VLNINPITYFILSIIILISIAIFAYQNGRSNCISEYQAKHVESLTRAIEQANEQAAIDAEILQSAIERKAENETRTNILTKEVVKYVASTPVLTDCALDDCGMCLATAAAKSADPSDCPCGTDVSVHATGSSDEQHDGRIARELYRNSEPPK